MPMCFFYSHQTLVAINVNYLLKQFISFIQVIRYSAIVGGAMYITLFVTSQKESTFLTSKEDERTFVREHILQLLLFNAAETKGMFFNDISCL